MKRIILIFIILLNIAYSNVISDLSFAILDSIVMSENRNDLETFFLQQKYFIQKYEIDKNYNPELKLIESDYLALIDKNNSYKDLNQNDKKFVVNEFLKNEALFSNKISGMTAVKYFEKAKVLYSQKEYFRSIKCLNIGLIRKKYHLISRKKYYESRIADINNFLMINDVPSAKIYIEIVSEEIKNKDASANIVKQISKLEYSIKKEYNKFLKKEKQNRYKTKFGNKKSIEIGFNNNIIQEKTTENEIWILHYNDKIKKNIAIDRFKQISSNSLFFSINKYFRNKYSIGGKVGFGKSVYKFISNELSDDFNVQRYYFSQYLNYYFRENIGIRPFVGIELGEYFYNMKKYSYYSNSGEDYIVYSYFESRQDFQIQTNFRLGFEYINNEKSKLMLNTYLMPYLNIKDLDYCGNGGLMYAFSLSYVL